MDQLPQQSVDEAECDEEAGPLSVNWQDEDGRDTVMIEGKLQGQLS